MKKILLSGLTLLVINLFAFAQKNKNKAVDFTKSTTAKDRLEGYQKRQMLSDSSLVQNLEFENIGPTIMSGRIVDVDVNPQDPTQFFAAYA